MKYACGYTKSKILEIIIDSLKYEADLLKGTDVNDQDALLVEASRYNALNELVNRLNIEEDE